MSSQGEQDSALVRAAKAVGTAAGKIAAAAGIPAGEPVPEDLYKAEYLGSGTFIIHKPHRKSRKLRQTRLKGTVRGART